jgi:hypothetical protein
LRLCAQVPRLSCTAEYNPSYAGAYAYGRRQFRRTIDGKKTVRTRVNNDWLAYIPDAHPGYISWEQHQENLKILKANGQGYDAARASIPREGAALLQGRAVCGQCGKHFRVRYAARRGRLEAWYICDRAHGYRGEPSCQSIAGPPVDEAIGMLIGEQMTPAAVELALEVRKEIEARYEEADRLRCRAIERAQIEADLAQRRFMLVDPNNRLVADTLEGEWNEKLRLLANAREERERAREHDQFTLDKAVRERPGAAARRGRHNARFTPLRVAYLVHQYNLRSRYDRLRERGMLTKLEAAARLNIHEHTLTRWAKHGLITSHAYNGHYCLYELPAQTYRKNNPADGTDWSIDLPHAYKMHITQNY